MSYEQLGRLQNVPLPLNWSTKPYDRLLNIFRGALARPPQLSGFQARLVAKVGLHNFCIWLNGSLRRAPLAFANLIGSRFLTTQTKHVSEDYCWNT